MIKKYLENRRKKREEIIKNKLLSFGGTCVKCSESNWAIKYDKPLIVDIPKTSFLNKIRATLRNFLYQIPSFDRFYEEEIRVRVTTVIYDSTSPNSCLLLYHSLNNDPVGLSFGSIMPFVSESTNSEINKNLYSMIEMNDIDNGR